MCWALLMGVSSVQALPLNPFQPHLSPCEKVSRELTGWVLRGVVNSPEGSVALMLSPQGTWQRIKPSEEIIAGVHIEEIDLSGVAANLAQNCQPSFYHWDIKGNKHDMDASTTSVSDSAIHKSGAERRVTGSR